MEDYGRIQKTGGGESAPLCNSPRGLFPRSSHGWRGVVVRVSEKAFSGGRGYIMGYFK